MYTPSHFREEELTVLRGLMRENPLVTLVTRTDAGIDANHIPVLVDDELTIIRGHVARANPVWKQPVQEALAIFTGPQYYVSPS